MYRSSGSKKSQGTKSAQDSNESNHKLKRPPKLNTVAAMKRQFAKQGTFTFGDSSTFDLKSRSPQTAKVQKLKKSGTLELNQVKS